MDGLQEMTIHSEDCENPATHEQLCQRLGINVPEQLLPVTAFSDLNTLGETAFEPRLLAAMQVFSELLLENNVSAKQVDRTLFDSLIATIDRKLSLQLDTLLHHPSFQALESSWRSLHYLIDKTDFSSNIKLEILDVSKEALKEDFDEATEISQSGLYKHIYAQEYDMPGGEPITAMVSDYVIRSSTNDINLLEQISKVAAAAHCPFFASADASFFNKQNMGEVMRIHDLENCLESASFSRWRAFRNSPDARYVGLTLPRFLLRLPYGIENPVQHFAYQENIADSGERAYLWGPSTFALASNMVNSFKQHGWTVNIRGPESGGKVENLPLHHYDIGRGLQTKIPTEALIAETRELDFANAGFIPLSYYKNSNFACFFSVNSIQQPEKFSSPEATANSRINARMPYIMLSARLGHYLKVLQRESIGSTKNRKQLESELNAWLQQLVTKMDDPSPQLIAERPLRDARVEVHTIPDNPGYYRVNLHVVPHFQVEGLDVTLSLVGELPAGTQ